MICKKHNKEDRPLSKEEIEKAECDKCNGMRRASGLIISNDPDDMTAQPVSLMKSVDERTKI